MLAQDNNSSSCLFPWLPYYIGGPREKLVKAEKGAGVLWGSAPFTPVTQSSPVFWGPPGGSKCDLHQLDTLSQTGRRCAAPRVGSMLGRRRRRRPSIGPTRGARRERLHGLSAFLYTHWLGAVARQPLLPGSGGRLINRLIRDSWEIQMPPAAHVRNCSRERVRKVE